MNGKTIGSIAAGGGCWIIGLIVLFGLAAFFFAGATWVSIHLLPWLIAICFFAIMALVLVVLPLSFFRKTRPYLGTPVYLMSYLFGTTLWMNGLLLSLAIWGAFAVWLGLFLGGIGVVPIAMLATLFKARWADLGALVIGTVLTLGTRFFGAWLISSTES